MKVKASVSCGGKPIFASYNLADSSQHYFFITTKKGLLGNLIGNLPQRNAEENILCGLCGYYSDDCSPASGVICPTAGV
jgi:hypothetical protein